MAISYLSAAKTACETADWTLTNLSLHKLLYLSHMKFLGTMNGRALIRNDFEAWKYGPVIPILYHKVKAYGADLIPDIFYVKRNLNLPQHKIIKDVVGMYGDFSPGDLVELTHKPGGAWDINYDPESGNAVIPNEDILNEYFEDPF